MRTTSLRVLLVLLPLLLSASPLTADDRKPVPDYARDIAPLLQKRCGGCHNAEDREGKLSTESYADLLKGGQRGTSLQPGDAGSSRLFLLITGQAKPVMPPDEDDRLKADEIDLIKRWIDGGARGPEGAEPKRTLSVPKLAGAKDGAKPVTALGLSPDGRLLAVARFATVELLDAANLQLVRRLEGFPGKVNSVEFSRDGKMLVAGSGVSGLSGQASLWNVESGQSLRTIDAHRDTLYAATLSPDGQTLATAGYDRSIELREAATGKLIRTLDGHNGAIFDLAFHPDGTILASASADQTVKLWKVATGERLDTLSQPLKEQNVVAFSPDGKTVVAGGLDNRIRVWKLVSREKPQINPLQFSRIAAEGAVIQLAFSPDGSRLVTVADDQSLKLWETAQYTQLAALARQPDVTPGLVIVPDGTAAIAGRLDGSIERIALNAAAEAASVSAVAAVAIPDRETQTIDEKEPNDQPDQAGQVTLPALIKGAIHPAGDAARDADVFRFSAKAGEQWVFEVNAARKGSPLDSKLEVLDAAGQPVPRVLLQAVRDSYITFRGIDSNTRDCRVHNWEEMDLNQYLYMNGEVAKLWLWPRGPDSGFVFYPERGNRRLYFDTTATAHAVFEPCYIVEPHPVGTKLLPNGLPTFTVNFENDDDSERELGTDSRLNFTAPRDGEYLLRVSDTRGFHGEKFTYEVTARPAQPDFTIRVENANPTVPSGSGKEFIVVADRKDGFEGPIRIELDGLPPGFHATSPLIIAEHQTVAYGTLNAEAGAPMPTMENAKTSKLTAVATINGQEVRREAGSLGEIKLADAPKVLVAIGPDVSGGDVATPEFGKQNPLEITIAPGETITARVHVQRNKFDGRIGFEAISQNLPHGIIIDNIGLNGLLIVEGQTQRQFFLTAAPWVPEQTRIFHLRSNEEAQTSWPVILQVKRKP